MTKLKTICLLSFLLGSMFTISFGQNIVTNDLGYADTQQSFSAGEDATICNDSEFQAEGRCKSSAITMWQTSGDGFFDDTQKLQAIYSPGVQDISNGHATLTLILFPMGGSGSEVISDEMNLRLGNCRAVNHNK